MIDSVTLEMDELLVILISSMLVLKSPMNAIVVRIRMAAGLNEGARSI